MKFLTFIRAIVLGISGLLLVTQAEAQTIHPHKIDLQEAIHLTLSNQPSLEKVEAQIEAAEAEANQKKSTYLPMVSVDAGYHYVAPVSAIEFNGGSLEVLPHNNYDAHFTAQQMIYDFGRTKANIAFAKSKTLSAQQQKEIVKWTLSYYTVQTFYSVLYLQKSMEVEDEQMLTLNEDLGIAQKKLENGAATDYDVLSIKVRIAEEIDRKLNLESQEKKMLIRLRSLFGWDENQPIKLTGTLEEKSLESNLKSEKPFLARPDYLALQHKKKELLQAYDLQEALDNPSLMAGATAGFKNGYQPELDELLGNFSVGVQLSVPIFDGYKQRYKLQQMKANIKEVDAASKEMQRKIEAEVASARVDVETEEQKLETADLQINQAEEQLRLAKVKYKNGVITNNDLLAAETALTRARFRKVTSTYNILLSQYNLQKATGVKIWL